MMSEQDPTGDVQSDSAKHTAVRSHTKDGRDDVSDDPEETV